MLQNTGTSEQQKVIEMPSKDHLRRSLPYAAKRRTNLTVDRVLNDDIDQRTAQIDYRVKLICDLFIRVIADNCDLKLLIVGILLEQITARGRRDVFTACTQQSNVTDNDLSADREQAGDGGCTDRHIGFTKQF